MASVPQKMSEIHIRAATLMALGMSNKDISTELNKDESTVSTWRNSNIFKAFVNRQLNEERRIAQSKINSLLNDSFNILEDILKSSKSSNSEKLRCVEIILKTTNLMNEKIGSESQFDLDMNDLNNNMLSNLAGLS